MLKVQSQIDEEEAVDALIQILDTDLEEENEALEEDLLGDEEEAMVEEEIYDDMEKENDKIVKTEEELNLNEEVEEVVEQGEDEEETIIKKEIDIDIHEVVKPWEELEVTEELNTQDKSNNLGEETPELVDTSPKKVGLFRSLVRRFFKQSA